jgi:hypothetical protein
MVRSCEDRTIEGAVENSASAGSRDGRHFRLGRDGDQMTGRSG